MGALASPGRGQLRPAATLEGRPSYIPTEPFSAALLHALSNPPSLAAAERDWSIDITRVRNTALALATSDTQAMYGQAKQLTGQTMLAVMEQARDPQGAAQKLDALKQRLQAGLAAPPGDGGGALPQVDLSKAANADQILLAPNTLPDGAPRT